MKDLNGRRRAEFTQADREYFARLREDLVRGPKGMCDPIEYAPLNDEEKRIEKEILELRRRLHAKMDDLTGRDADD